MNNLAVYSLRRRANLVIPYKDFQAVLTRFQMTGFIRPWSLLSICLHSMTLFSLGFSSRILCDSEASDVSHRLVKQVEQNLIDPVPSFS